MFVFNFDETITPEQQIKIPYGIGTGGWCTHICLRIFKILKYNSISINNKHPDEVETNLFIKRIIQISYTFNVT